MPDYRRAWHPGGTWFFTVNLLQRQGNDLLVRHIDVLRHAVETTPVKHGWVAAVRDWPHSTFHRLVKAGVYPENWAGGKEGDLARED